MTDRQETDAIVEGLVIPGPVPGATLLGTQIPGTRIQAVATLELREERAVWPPDRCRCAARFRRVLIRIPNISRNI